MAIITDEIAQSKNINIIQYRVFMCDDISGVGKIFAVTQN